MHQQLVLRDALVVTHSGDHMPVAKIKPAVGDRQRTLAFEMHHAAAHGEDWRAVWRRDVDPEMKRPRLPRDPRIVEVAAHRVRPVERLQGPRIHTHQYPAITRRSSSPAPLGERVTASPFRRERTSSRARASTAVALDEPVAHPADVLLNQDPAEPRERAGTCVIQHPDDRLSFQNRERDVGLICAHGTFEGLRGVDEPPAAQKHSELADDHVVDVDHCNRHAKATHSRVGLEECPPIFNVSVGNKSYRLGSCSASRGLGRPECNVPDPS